MSREPTIAELLDRLAAARLAQLVRENRELRARLAAETPRRPPAPGRGARRSPPADPADGRPRLRLVRGETAR